MKKLAVLFFALLSLSACAADPNRAMQTDRSDPYQHGSAGPAKLTATEAITCPKGYAAMPVHQYSLFSGILPFGGKTTYVCQPEAIVEKTIDAQARLAEAYIERGHRRYGYRGYRRYRDSVTVRIR